MYGSSPFVYNVTVGTPLVAPVICCDQDVCSGSNAAALTITTPPTGGSGIYNRQWQWSPDNSTWNNQAGATGLTYTSNHFGQILQIGYHR